MIFYPEELRSLRHAYLMYKTITNAKRFQIYNIIDEHQPINVSDIVDRLSIDQAIVSQNIAMLRKAEFVTNKKNQKKIYYSTFPKTTEKLLKATAEILNKEIDNRALSKNYSNFKEAAQLLKILTNSSRLVLLEAICKNNGTTQQELKKSTNIVQSIISQNLKILNELGLLIKKKEHRATQFYLDKEKINRVKKATIKLVSNSTNK